MYVPKHLEETRIEILHKLIQEQPLATLITMSTNGLDANHIPLHLSDESSLGTLRGHVDRANPMWHDLMNDIEGLAIFHGLDSYVSPSWYPTKKETGKVVPTWNYAVVHAYGSIRIINDALWIREHLESLTNHNEIAMADPWTVSDAPHKFTENLINAIVGIEIVITKLLGKWKVSQNQPEKNRAGVISGLMRNECPKAKGMATMITDWKKSKSKSQ